MSQLEELREILVGANADELAALKQRIEDVESRTRDVSEVLAPAIASSDTKALVSSLQTPVSLSLKQAIRFEPQEYAEILYPVMAPAIRRAISQAISSLLVTINRTVESATSVKGLKTRMQSMRTGVPYAELALRHSLLYRVEHVYLIDRESGMQVAEVTSLETESLDGDAVSAMFSAIQSFVQDSFSQDPSARLTDLKVGDHNVWVAHGPTLMLACVILGDAPEGLKSDLYDALYKIRTDYGVQIAAFNGDSDAFEGVEMLMQPLLQLRLKEGDDDETGGDEDAEPSRRNSIPFIAVGLVLLFIGYQWFAHNNKLSTVEYYLKQTPGIEATDLYWQGGKLVVEGLKDPEAVIPYGALEAYDIEPAALEFETIPFRSLEVDMEMQRFRRDFTLPAGVYLSVREGKIYLYGKAPIQWLRLNNARIRQLAADNRVIISALSASESSVYEILSNNLAAESLKALNLITISTGKMETLNIQGALDSSDLLLLTSLFASSRWVNVDVETAQSKVEDVPIES